jgi:hypothetical protein
MRKLLFALAATTVAAVAPQASAANIYVDTFDSPNNPSFFTDYELVTQTGAQTMYPAGTYAIGTDAANYHDLWASYKDHTSGAGNYMIVNGYTDASKIVWQSGDITLGAGTYTFSAWVANSCCNFNIEYNAPPELSFSGIVGQPVSQIVSSGAGAWVQLATTFTVGTGGAVGKLTLSNASSASSGNDFGVDDIILTAGDQAGVLAVPEAATWGLMVLGFGAIGAASRRRRTSLTFG